MRVIVPYADGGPHPLTRDALEEQAPGRVEYHDVGARGDDYWRLLLGVWADGEDFLLVEHDNVIAAGTVTALDACESEWCTCPPCGAGQGFQVNRFRAAVMKKAPAAVADVPVARRYWIGLDSAVRQRLRYMGVKAPHVHGDLPQRHMRDLATRSTWPERWRELREWLQGVADSHPRSLDGLQARWMLGHMGHDRTAVGRRVNHIRPNRPNLEEAVSREATPVDVEPVEEEFA